MFKPHKGTCVECKKEEQLIVVKKGYCQKCNWDIKQAKKKSEGKKSGKYQYKRKPTGEMETFHRVLNDLPDEPTRCFVCGVLVPVITHHNFAHILPKGRHPLFRNKSENIRVMCYKIDGTGCHSKYDFYPKSELKGENWDRVFELKRLLLEEYKYISKL